MLHTRRTFLASCSVAASVIAAVNTRIRAGCVVTADGFDSLLASLRQMQGLGYSGFSTPLRVMQSQTGRMDEVRAQLAEVALDLIGVRASLPKYAELGNDRALEDLSRVAMAARQFGARTLMVHSPGLAADGKFNPQDLDAKAKFFDLCAKRCKETGVIFTYRTQEAEFQNEAAEITGLLARTDKNITYFDLDLGRALKAYPDAITFFRDNPGRTFAMEAAFGDPAFKVHDLAAAVKHTHWISWLIDTTPNADSRAVTKKVFAV